MRNKLTTLFFCAAAFYMTACALFTKEQAPKTLLTFKQLACIAEHAFVDDPTLNSLCDLRTVQERYAGREVARNTRVAVAQARVAQPCSSSLPYTDGGAQ